MRQPEAEARRWLAQAESDLAFAEVGVREGFFAQACFICQQAGEKALKALHYRRGARMVLVTRLPSCCRTSYTQMVAESSTRSAKGSRALASLPSSRAAS